MTSLFGVIVSLAGVICFVGSTYVKGSGNKNAGTDGTCIENTCTRPLLVLELLVPGISMLGVLVSLSKWEYTCNLFKSQKWSNLGLD